MRPSAARRQRDVDADHVRRHHHRNAQHLLTRTDAFDDTDQTTANLISAQAANAIAKSELFSEAKTIRAQLQAEYDERSLIAYAQGILVALEDCSTDQALHLIQNAADAKRSRSSSPRTNSGCSNCRSEQSGLTHGSSLRRKNCSPSASVVAVILPDRGPS